MESEAFCPRYGERIVPRGISLARKCSWYIVVGVEQVLTGLNDDNKDLLSE